MKFLVIVLLQIFWWFWKWNNFENWWISDKVKAYKNNVPIFFWGGGHCILCYKEIHTSSKIRALPSGTFPQTLDLILSRPINCRAVLSTLDWQWWSLAYYTDHPPLCTARWVWSGMLWGSICDSWDLSKRLQSTSRCYYH